MSTSSTYRDIRGALQARTLTSEILPARGQIAYEGRNFDMTIGIPYATMNVMPVSGKPFSVDGNTRALQGLFQVSLYYPSDGQGASAVEAAADSVIAVFKSGTRLFSGSTIVIIDYAERTAILAEEGWLHLPVTVGWRAFPTS